MKPYIISYEIKETATQTYQPFFDEIKKSDKWWHFISNTWIIMSEGSANDVYSRFKPYLDNNINIIVFELGVDRQGWLPNKAWNWLKENIPRK